MARASPREIVVETHNLHRSLGSPGATPTPVLRGVSMCVGRGELVALTGSSGSGKSTLLYLLGALDRPSAGEIWICGTELSILDEDERARFRNERLGFVFQFHFLLPEFTVLENVAIPMFRRGEVTPDEAEAQAHDVLVRLGLGEVVERRPNQLSGGQQQRVSIARAVTNDPLLILADEPTGNLDSKSAESVFEVFMQLTREQGRTIVMVTHDDALAARCDRRIRLKDGVIIADE